MTPRRTVRLRAGDSIAQRRDEGGEEPDVPCRAVVAQAEIQESRRKRDGELAAGAFHQRDDPRRRRKGLEERLVIVELLPQTLERRARRVEEFGGVDVLQCDSVREVIEA